MAVPGKNISIRSELGSFLNCCVLVLACCRAYCVHGLDRIVIVCIVSCWLCVCSVFISLLIATTSFQLFAWLSLQLDHEAALEAATSNNSLENPSPHPLASRWFPFVLRN